MTRERWEQILFAHVPDEVVQDMLNAYVLELEAENAKLRELVGLWSVINKHMSLCATTDCGQCPVREECEESVYLEGLLGIDQKWLSWRVQERMAETTDFQAENSKLRELCADLYAEMITYSDAPNYNASVWAPKLRELGVEVEL